MKITTKSLGEVESVAKDFVNNFIPFNRQEKSATVLAFAGDLGSGKTTFTQALARRLGVTTTITSPTFLIQKVYPLTGQLFNKLIHVDAYRLEKAEELLRLGFLDLLNDRDNLIIIEWPEKVAEILPTNAVFVKFAFVSETEHTIEYGD